MSMPGVHQKNMLPSTDILNIMFFLSPSIAAYIVYLIFNKRDKWQSPVALLAGMSLLIMHFCQQPENDTSRLGMLLSIILIIIF